MLKSQEIFEKISKKCKIAREASFFALNPGALRQKRGGCPAFVFAAGEILCFFGGAVVIWTGAVLALWGRLVLLQGKAGGFGCL